MAKKKTGSSGTTGMTAGRSAISSFSKRRSIGSSFGVTRRKFNYD